MLAERTIDYGITIVVVSALLVANSPSLTDFTDNEAKIKAPEIIFDGFCSIGYQVDPIHLKITPKSMRIDQGGIARFYCKDNSETTSTIDWISETGDLPKEATTNRGVLTIVNVQRKHSGLYTCIGSNQHSTDRVTVQLKVGGKL